METKIEIGSCGNKKYGIKTIALFSDGGKRTELYKSSRTIAYYSANAIQTNVLLFGGLGLVVAFIVELKISQKNRKDHTR